MHLTNILCKLVQSCYIHKNSCLADHHSPTVQHFLRPLKILNFLNRFIEATRT